MSRGAAGPAGLEPVAVLALTVDLGNSRIKAVAWRAGGPLGSPSPGARFALEPGDAVRPEVWSARFEELRLSAPLRLALSTVAGSELSAAVAAALRRAFGAPLADPPPHGLRLEVERPETVGQDRLFAARGAAALGRSAIVLDAGTALTVDAVAVGPDGPPCFLGGAIAPGPSLLIKALASGAARLFEVELRPGARALGRQTSEALEAGVVVGFRGAAFELARRVGLEAGLATAPRLLCGGAARFLLEPEPFWPGELIERPDLVHEGLLAALGDLT
jgi:type III pantothenate kinase